MTGMRLAILDDYQGYAATFGRWDALPGVDVVSFRDHVDNEDDLVRRLFGFDAVMRIRERTAFPAAVLGRLPQLKLILATGMRNAGTIDLAAADALGMTVCATDAHHQSTIEIVWIFILALFRGVERERASLRAGGWQVGLGRGLAGRTLGILGLGNMGIPVARIGQGFGMNVIAWSPNLTPERAAPHSVTVVAKEELFASADVVSLHMPLNERTRGIVGAVDIERMKSGAYLVNTSREPLVDRPALLAALRDRRIGGLGIDVFETEPLPQDHPYRTLPNVIATPHIGFVTEENYRLIFREAFENLVAFVNGSPIRTISAAQPFLADSQVGMQRGRKG